MGRASAKPRLGTSRQSWLVALLSAVLLASQFPTSLLFSAAVPRAALAAADVLYGVNSADDGLSRIDPTTGQVTFIGRLDPDTTKMTTPIAMAVRPSDSKI